MNEHGQDLLQIWLTDIAYRQSRSVRQPSCNSWILVTAGGISCEDIMNLEIQMWVSIPGFFRF